MRRDRKRGRRQKSDAKRISRGQLRFCALGIETLEQRTLLDGTPLLLGGETLVNTAVTGNQRNADVAMDAAGNYVVVWDDDNAGSIFARRYNSDGLPQGSPFRVNTVDPDVNSLATPAIAMDEDGDFVVVWNAAGSYSSSYGSGSYTYTPFDNVRMQRFNALGVKQGPELRVHSATDGQHNPDVAMDASGDFVVAWDESYYYYGVSIKRFNAAGVAQGGAVQVNTSGPGETPAIAIDGDGDFVVAFDRNVGSGYIMARQFNASGVPLTPDDFQVDSTTNEDSLRDPAVGMDATGNFVVAWAEEETPLGSGYFDIRARRYSAAGVPLDVNDFLVNTDTLDTQQTPAVAMNGAGEFLIVWSGDDPGGGATFDAYGQFYNANGSRAGIEFEIPTTENGGQLRPSAAINDNNNFVVTWDGNGEQPGQVDTQGVFAQRLFRPFETSVEVVAGVLTVTDINTVSDDTLDIRQDPGDSNFLLVSDPNRLLQALAGTTQVDGRTVRVPIAGLTGIVVNTVDGQDSLELQASLVEVLIAQNIGLTYNAGNPTAGPGDSLTLTGGTWDSVTYNHTNASSGTVQITKASIGAGTAQIAFNGIEPLTNTGTAANVIFNLTSGIDNAVLEDDGTAGNGLMRLRSANGSFETTTFTVPSGSLTIAGLAAADVIEIASVEATFNANLTINGGAGNDTITISSLGPAFNSNITINGGTQDDTVNLNADVTFAAGNSLDVNLNNDGGPATGTDQILIGTHANMVASGSGTITLAASRNINMGANSSLVAANGDISISANHLGTLITGFTGIEIDNALVRTTGSGNITVTGRGATGVRIDNGGRIEGGTAGLVSVTGSSPNPTGNNRVGVEVTDNDSFDVSSITSNGANVTVNGTGGGNSGFCYGVYLEGGGRISAGGMGTVTVQGTGGGGTMGFQAYGVLVIGGFNLVGTSFFSNISSAGGDISVTGVGGGGTGAGVLNSGFRLDQGALINAVGAGSIDIHGTSGASTGNSNEGVLLSSQGPYPTRITSADGNISITGISNGAGTGVNQSGVSIRQPFSPNAPIEIRSLGTGDITIVGTGGPATGVGNYGIGVTSNNFVTVASAGGDITLMGMGGGAMGSSSNLGVELGVADLMTTGAGRISITGIGGSGSGRGVNALPVSDITTVDGEIVITGTASGAFASGNEDVNFGSGGSIQTTGSGSISITADSLALLKDIKAGPNNVTVKPRTAGRPIELGSADSATVLGLSSTELLNLFAGTLIIGDGVSGPITVTASVSDASTNLQLVSGGDIVISGGQINSPGGTLLLDPGPAPAAVKPTRAGVDVIASTLSFGSDLAIVINGTTVNTQYTQLNVIGSVDLTGVSLVLSGSYTPAAGDRFVIVSNDGTDAVIGIFNGLPQGASVVFNGQQLYVNYFGGDGNDVTLTASIIVDTVADTVAADGFTSLREAINTSNSSVGISDTIRFSIPRPFTNDLVSWWRGEGNANDIVDGNHGTLQNGATATGTGRYSQAFALDGIDDEIALPGTATGNLDITGDQLTVDAWVNPTTYRIGGTGQVVFDKWFDTIPNGYDLDLQDGRLRFQTATTASGGAFTLTAPTAVPLNAWSHVAVTYDGANVRLYVNGVEQASAPLTGNILHNSFDASIGNDNDPGLTDSGFTGGLDEVGVFNRALSAAEVLAIASGPRTISPTSALPTITDPVVIDGYTQPGASANTLAGGDNAVQLIELNGAGAGLSDGLDVLAGGSTIRGLVINQFELAGVRLRVGGNNVVEGNFIGTDTTGTMDPGNEREGVLMAGSSGNRVGGNLPAARNVISGNGESGIAMFFVSGNNTVLGNFIGTDRNGTAGLGNSTVGVLIVSTAGNNTIGGSTAGDRNIISDNQASGIQINNSVGPNFIRGNYIGTDVTGTVDLGNGSSGVFLGDNAPNTQVGGVLAGEGNLISGNNSHGIAMFSGTDGTLVQGNRIGTDVTGLLDLGNAESGVILTGSSGNTIGGTTSAARNIISGNDSPGVFLTGIATNFNLVQGNFIGVDITGIGALGNDSKGVFLEQGAHDNTIGGTITGAGNTIAFNDGVGIAADSNAGDGNSFLGNSIFANLDIGIDLNFDGITDNDPGDADTGPNRLQNFPVLTSIDEFGGGTQILGVLNGPDDTSYRVEFFVSNVADDSGFGEGQTYLGFVNVSTPANGIAPISFMTAGVFPPGSAFTATATDPSGNTSEFSGAISLLDFGDAPDSYGTTLASNGARHTPAGSLLLGFQRDEEGNAETPLDGSGDDDNGGENDEDGVSFASSMLFAGDTDAVDVEIAGSSGNARLCGWIDFNRDGDFNDTGEQISDGSTLLGNGVQTINFAIPADASPGISFARFRVSTQAGLSFNGLANDGEVEDHAIPICSLVVTTNLDIIDPTDHLNSLREAILCANEHPGADTITLPDGVYTLAISGAGENLGFTGDLDITDHLTINGAGAATTIVDGNDLDRVFHVRSTPGINAAFSGLTIRNGQTTGRGGGILQGIVQGTLTIRNSIITDNQAGTGGGGVSTDAALLIEDSSVSGNRADGYAGGIEIYGGSMTLRRSTVDSNMVTGVAGMLFGGGGIYVDDTSGPLLIDRSTISRNTTREDGGGIHLDVVDHPVTIVNSTISGNTARSGGGIYVDQFTFGHLLTIQSSTVAGNAASVQGGGILEIDETIVLESTIVANNTAATPGPDLFCMGDAGVYRVAYSLIEDFDSAQIDETLPGTNLFGRDPLLATLANNGGPTETHALLAGSPALNTGHPASFPPIDQRGVARAQGPAPDIGAFESETFSQLFLSINDVTVTEGTGGGTNAIFTVTLSGPTSVPVSVVFNTAEGSAGASDFLPTYGFLSFAPLQTTRLITVVVNGDAIDESDETFAVNLLNATNATVLDSTGIGTIDDDDDAPLPAISIGDVSVIEGNAGSVATVFTVTLSTVSLLPVTVNFNTADGSANSADYQAASGSLVFLARQTEQFVTVQVLGDTAAESNETFLVNLSNPGNATIADGQGIGTIVDDDARAIFVTGADAGGGPHVKVFDASTSQLLFGFMAYDPRFGGGVRVAVGDVNGDGTDDIITGAGPSGGPHVRVFDGRTGAQLPGPIGSFMAYNPLFGGGVYVAAGDVNGDGADDVITGADAGGGPHVRVFDGRTGAQIAGRIGSFFAYKAEFNAGVRVAAGDVDGDGRADVITGMGAGYGDDTERTGFRLLAQPEVRVYSGATGLAVFSFNPFEAGYRGGVHLAVVHYDADDRVEIVVGKANGDARTDPAFNRVYIDPFRRSEFSIFQASGSAMVQRLTQSEAYDGFGGSVRVAAVDAVFRDAPHFDPVGDYLGPILLTGAGPGGGPHVKLRADNLALIDEFFAYDELFSGGVFVAGSVKSPVE